MGRLTTYAIAFVALLATGTVSAPISSPGAFSARAAERGASVAATQHVGAVRLPPSTRPGIDLIEAALRKAEELDDPRPAVVYVARAAITYDPEQGVPYVRRAAAVLQGKKLPPAEWIAFRDLAALVAPQDLALRDTYLQQAVEEAHAALGDRRLWLVKPLPPGQIPFQEPQKAKDEARLLLGFYTRVWESVLEARNDRDRAARRLASVFDESEAAGRTGGDNPTTFKKLTWWEAAGLDPDLLLKAAAGEPQKMGMATFCFERATDREAARRFDAFTRTLITFAVENGKCNGRSLRLYKHFDLERAWRLAQDLPDDDSANGRFAALGEVIIDYAWKRPDEALAVAEAEKDEGRRRTLIEDVSWVWAFKRPEQIERAIRRQDNALRRQWVREAAADELAHRRAGHPARDTPATIPGEELPLRFRSEPADEATKARRIESMLEGLIGKRD